MTTPERPIIMTAESVRSILTDRKMQTRRIVTLQPTMSDFGWSWPSSKCRSMVSLEEMRSLGPYGARGDRLWVKETWSHDAPDIDACRAAYEDVFSGLGYGPYYKATEVAPDTLRWISPIYMPRWASRLTLEVTEVRVQRLQDISEDDALAEGVDEYDGTLDEAEICAAAKRLGCMATDSRAWYAVAWDHINAKRASWTSNPWIWAITFRRVDR